MLSFLKFAYAIIAICIFKSLMNTTKIATTDFIYLIIPNCVFSYVSSSRQPELMHSRTGCICLSFLHCAFSYVSSNRLRDMMHTHIGCICLIFLCPLSLSLKPDWLCFYYNLLVQNFDPFPAYKKCAVSCNSCFQLKAHWFWIVRTEIESESKNWFSRPR